MRPRSQRRRGGAIVLLAILLLVGIGATVAVVNYDGIRAQYLRYITLDFEGPGVGEVMIRVDSGDDGLAIARKLFDAGVVKDLDSFYRLMIETNPTFFPGSYLMKMEMSNQAALGAITDKSNLVTYKITIPEGYRAVLIFDEISRISGIPQDELRETAADTALFGLPAEAKNIEGFLFPATYSFDPQASAEEIIRTMVNRMFSELDAFGVPEADRYRVLTFASIVQREAKLKDDFYKVARVLTNRLAIDMRLETDPTISYSFDGTDMSKKSNAEQLEHGYNTYLVKGLPPGPISSPGSIAIDATLNPVPGDWLFFVTIDLRTGETKFSKTLSQHEKYVKLLRKWERENPGWYDD